MKLGGTIGRGILLCALLFSRGAWAQSAADKTAAETLFEEGRTLLREGKTEQACHKLEGSQRLDPAPGTQLNLADCYERLGRLASAWINFTEAAGIAKIAGDQNRMQIAKQRAAELAPKLSRLTIVVPDAVRSISGLELTRDGAAVDPLLWGSAVPVDPGRHVVAVKAPGYRNETLEVAIGSERRDQTVEVPVLTREPAAHGTEASAPAPAAKATPAATSREVPSGSSQRTWALVAGGAGLVGLGIGGYFGLRTMSTWSDAQRQCQDSEQLAGCNEEAARLSRDARTSGNVATVAFAVGAGGLGVGTLLWVTTPAEVENVAIHFGPGEAAAGFRGSF